METLTMGRHCLAIIPQVLFFQLGADGNGLFVLPQLPRMVLRKEVRVWVEEKESDI